MKLSLALELALSLILGNMDLKCDDQSKSRNSLKQTFTVNGTRKHTKHRINECEIPIKDLKTDPNETLTLIEH